MTRYSDFKTTQAQDENILDKETQVYATFADLPLTNVRTGMKAYVQSNNSLYFWTGAGWSKIALINTAPIATFDQSSYSMDSAAGSPTILTLTASDPEEIPLTYSYSFIPSNIVDSAISYVEDSSTITLTTTAVGGLYNFKVIGSVSDGIYVTSDSADINLTLSAVISITRSATSIYEGGSVTFTVNTVGYPNGSLIPYTITGINSADINGASLSGNVTINNNAGALTLTTTLDTAGVVEGLETITFNAGGLSQTCSIIDVVPGSATVSTPVNEDGTNQVAYFGLSNYPNTIYYTTNTTSADIQNPSGACTFRFQNTVNGEPFYNWQANLGGVIADNLTEGNETVTISFRKDSISGQVLKTTTFVINDTSLTPAPVVSGTWRWLGGWSNSGTGYTHWDYGRTPKGIFLNSTPNASTNSQTTLANWTTRTINGSTTLRCYDGGSSGIGTGTLYFTTNSFSWTNAIAPNASGGFGTYSTGWQILFNTGSAGGTVLPEHSWVNGSSIYNGYAFYYGALQSQTRYLEIDYY